MAKTSKSQRISYLRNLIEHPRTSEGEREAAKRALGRVMATEEIREDAERAPEDYAWYGLRTYGSKYTGTYQTAAEIAKLIRADVKLAMKAARAEAKDGEIAVPDPLTRIPAEVKLTVKSSNFSGGRSIDIVMRNVPKSWGFEMRDDLNFGYERQCVSGELKAVAKALKAILDAYNYDGSDPNTDYFDVNFYGHVVSDSGLMLA